MGVYVPFFVEGFVIRSLVQGCRRWEMPMIGPVRFEPSPLSGHSVTDAILGGGYFPSFVFVSPSLHLAQGGFVRKSGLCFLPLLIHVFPIIEGADQATSRLRTALNLGEEDVEKVIIPDGLWQIETAYYRLCLVGRLLSRKLVNFEGLSALVRSTIMPVKGMENKQLPPDRFLFRFNHVLDKNQALEGCSWSFEKNILILNGIRVNENPMQVELNWCEFHVHVHEFSLSKMNLRIATFF
ncbi:UNVERIFIED_CONTAM: hypothetical protein Slati_2972600 [Sesamum latifolium]|uniref:DUF4283 domain-containing protein n=1 Tax=Sesamum latifolium TaxID=2727402 RepID=A0AAW2VFM2_9LAMI